LRGRYNEIKIEQIFYICFKTVTEFKNVKLGMRISERIEILGKDYAKTQIGEKTFIKFAISE